MSVNDDDELDVEVKGIIGMFVFFSVLFGVIVVEFVVGIGLGCSEFLLFGFNLKLVSIMFFIICRWGGKDLCVVIEWNFVRGVKCIFLEMMMFLVFGL